jgi:hypothetical protein
LRLVIVHTSEGTSVEYDMAEWARLCRHPNRDSPLACPDLEPLLKEWLGGR